MTAVNFAPVIENLQNLAHKSLNFGGKVFIDEEKFFIEIVQLRKTIPDIARHLQDKKLMSAQATQIWLEIDKTEQFIEKGTSCLFGRVLVDKANYLQQIEQLRHALAALERDLAS